MALETGAFMQANSYSAEIVRRAVFAQYARTSANNPGIISGGLIGATDFQISQVSSPNMTVNVSTGEAIVPGNEGGAQGGYYVRGTSTTNLAISTADPSNPRIDTVCLTCGDAQYTLPSGGTSGALTLQVVTGTPTAGATLSNLSGAAALPGSSLLLGYVLVPAGATNIITADILNVAVAVQLGLSNAGPWQALTLATNIASGGYGASARLEGTVVRLRGTLTNNTGSADSGTLATIPSGLRSSGNLVLVAGLGTNSSGGLQISSAGAVSVGTGLTNGVSVSLDGITYTLS